MQEDYDIIVVGSGPNGLAAAIKLQSEGLEVLLIEGKETIGGGMRTAELTLPGFRHDICSAVHPTALASPFMASLPLHRHGLKYIWPEIDCAHPFDDGSAAHLERSVRRSAASLGEDTKAYCDIYTDLASYWCDIAPDVLGPLTFPSCPRNMLKFGIRALQPATWFARHFRTRAGKGLWAGMAAHSLQPLSNYATSAIGLVLTASGHDGGWPVPEGGSQAIADAMGSLFTSMGGTVRTGYYVCSLEELPHARAVLLDVTPRQLLDIAGDRLSTFYRWQLKRYRYGMGVFKIDWALDEPIPFKAEACRRAGTVHLGNTLEEIVHSEKQAAQGKLAGNPFVLLTQPSIIDHKRSPEGKHTAWAYCHVPHGSVADRTEAIENQVERFAPGFKDVILARNTMNTIAMQDYNPNYVGGDINGGVIDIGQLFTRPAWRRSPYRTSAKGVYLCSSSTPPGGGVHGMCGYHAAVRVLKDLEHPRR